MDLNLLEAKDPFVTLHFDAFPHQFRIRRRTGNVLSLQIPESDVANILSPGMKCRVAFQDGKKKAMVIDKVSREKEGLILECTLIEP